MQPESADLRAHLLRSRLSGEVATPPRSTLENCEKLASGQALYTFGLTDWRHAQLDDAITAVERVCRNAPRAMDPAGPGWIDPDATMDSIAEQRQTLERFVQSGSGTVLLATGHPQGLLEHYIGIASALASAGAAIAKPLNDVVIGTTDEPDAARPRGIRYIGGVACAFDGGGLRHSHSSMYMQAMLAAAEDEGTPIDLVLADHGMAGVAIEAGITTLSIADVNDPALFLAQTNGRTSAVMPIDDNLSPALFTPVTRAVTEGISEG